MLIEVESVKVRHVYIFFLIISLNYGCFVIVLGWSVKACNKLVHALAWESARSGSYQRVDDSWPDLSSTYGRQS